MIKMEGGGWGGGGTFLSLSALSRSIAQRHAQATRRVDEHAVRRACFIVFFFRRRPRRVCVLFSLLYPSQNAIPLFTLSSTKFTFVLLLLILRFRFLPLHLFPSPHAAAPAPQRHAHRFATSTNRTVDSPKNTGDTTPTAHRIVTRRARAATSTPPRQQRVKTPGPGAGAAQTSRLPRGARGGVLPTPTGRTTAPRDGRLPEEVTR